MIAEQGRTRRQSRPANNASNCAWLSDITPSRIAGHTKLGTGLAVLDGHDPLLSDPRFAGKLGLAQLELAAFVADGETEVQGSSNLHDSPMSSNADNTCLSPNDDKSEMSVIDDTLMAGCCSASKRRAEHMMTDLRLTSAVLVCRRGVTNSPAGSYAASNRAA